MEICEAFGLSMCAFDPMLKGLRGSGPTKGLPNASSAPPPPGLWGAFIRRAEQGWTLAPRQPIGHPARVPDWPCLPPRANRRLRQELEGLGPELGQELLQ